MKKLFVLFAVCATSIILSCSKDDPQPDCGCEGPTLLVLKNTRAVHESAGLFTFTHPITLSKTSAWACDVDSLWAKSENNGIPDYTISGNLKKECFFGPTSMIVFPSIEITAIKKD
ncbi:hypothetical protein SAMN05216327_11494 [Dyadobacter sp. SG02]|uniref:hypothetical protein n=1 Tax=Dyadobacter sp. SG02 TaxID=1855291 RepID=UPI0008B4E945|nr:hypothetical protein [Dyadobacter sp. SG02]SEJ61971.1 hypothetical protein SAMN05216327_11494 [Dyadobacter sp. SG02]